MMPLSLTRKSIDKDFLEQAIKELLAAFSAVDDIEDIYLFGSAALGKMSDQSDLDVLVIVSKLELIRSAQIQLRHIQKVTPFPVDIVWVDREGFERKKHIGGVCYLAVNEGRHLFSKRSKTA